MRRRLLNDRGLTLVETLVTIAILAGIAASVASFHQLSLKQWQSNDIQAEIQQSVRRGVAVISQNARTASAVQVVGSSLDLTFLQAGVQKRVRYEYDGSVLYEQGLTLAGSNSGSRQPIALYIREFKATWDGKLITIVLTGQEKDSMPYTVTTKVYPRGVVN